MFQKITFVIILIISIFGCNNTQTKVEIKLNSVGDSNNFNSEFNIENSDDSLFSFVNKDTFLINKKISYIDSICKEIDNEKEKLIKYNYYFDRKRETFYILNTRFKDSIKWINSETQTDWISKYKFRELFIYSDLDIKVEFCFIKDSLKLINVFIGDYPDNFVREDKKIYFDKNKICYIYDKFEKFAIYDTISRVEYKEFYYLGQYPILCNEWCNELNNYKCDGKVSQLDLSSGLTIFNESIIIYKNLIKAKKID